MPSVWITRRKTAAGKTRHRVEFHLGGRGSRNRYGGTFATKREALIRKAWIAGELAALRVPDLTTLTEAAPMPTFETASTAWRDSRVDAAHATQIQHRTSINRALPTIGKLRLDEITPHEIMAVVTTLHNDGIAPDSIRKTIQACAMTLDHAGITPNPARDRVIVKLPRNTNDEVDPPTAADLVAMFKRLPRKHRLAFLWLELSGARVGAIDKTLIGDYDEINRRIRLRASTMKMGKAQWVELPDVFADAVEASLPSREQRDLAARLFTESGADALRTAMAKACSAAGVRHVKPHDLRHRRISLLHAGGMTWAEIGQRVAQRDIATTANTYTHVIADTTELDYAELLAA